VVGKRPTSVLHKV